MVRSTTSGRTEIALQQGSQVSTADELLLKIESSAPGYRGAAVLAGPVTWTLGEGITATADFVAHGLGDFSGIARYRTELSVADTGAVLPSPFSRMQRPGGGFSGVLLRST